MKITRPCAATRRDGGARSSTVAAIGAWYQEMKNNVAIDAKYSGMPGASSSAVTAQGRVASMPATIVHSRPVGRRVLSRSDSWPPTMMPSSPSREMCRWFCVNA